MAYGLQFENKTYLNNFISSSIEPINKTLNKNDFPLEIFNFSNLRGYPIILNGNKLVFNKKSDSKYGVMINGIDLNSEFRIATRKTMTFYSLHGKNTGYGNEFERYMYQEIQKSLKDKFILFRCIEGTIQKIVIEQIELVYGGNYYKYGVKNKNTYLTKLNMSFNINTVNIKNTAYVLNPNAHYGMAEFLLPFKNNQWISANSVFLMMTVFLAIIRSSLSGASNEYWLSPDGLHVRHIGGLGGDGGGISVNDHQHYLPLPIYVYSIN